MTKNAPLAIIILIVSLLLGCSENPGVDQEVELSSAEVSEKIMDMIVLEQEKERAIVRQHYNMLSSEEKSELTFNQYYAELAHRYQRYTAKALAEGKSLNSDQDPQLQVEQLQEDLSTSEEIPEWYWLMKQATKEKIVNMTLIRR